MQHVAHRGSDPAHRTTPPNAPSNREIGVSGPRVMEIRKDLGCGVYEARRIAAREDLIAAINAAATMDDLKPILRAMVNAT